MNKIHLSLIKQNDVDTASLIKNKNVTNKLSQKDIRTFY